MARINGRREAVEVSNGKDRQWRWLLHIQIRPNREQIWEVPKLHRPTRQREERTQQENSEAKFWNLTNEPRVDRAEVAISTAVRTKSDTPRELTAGQPKQSDPRRGGGEGGQKQQEKDFQRYVSVYLKYSKFIISKWFISRMLIIIELNDQNIIKIVR